ncbi:MAG: transcription antitermination protein NusB, partial [Gemmatimonadetes bacterium]|nr:transcription antitermination protein NusB [Gemmatimonadota bacterium]
MPAGVYPRSAEPGTATGDPASGGGLTRRLALSVLLEVEAGRRLDVAWEASGAAKTRQRGWIRTLVYGTVRLQGRLDHVLARFTSRPPGELDPEVRAVLRMGAYQILEMDAVPAYAAVSESVALVKGGAGRAAAGLVNAVLRRVAREGAPDSSFTSPE